MNSGVGRGTTNRVVQEQLDLSANVGYTEKTHPIPMLNWRRGETTLQLTMVK